MIVSYRNTFVLWFVLLCSVASPILAEDWPQWRGVNRDAVIQEQGLMKTLPAGTLPRRWSVPVGSGYSGPSVAKGLVFLTDRGPEGIDKEVERVLCFKADDGELVWEHTYDASYTVGYRAGPRASVTIHEDSAISVGAMGHLKCLDTGTGEIKWERDLNEEYEIRMPIWGITAAPLVYKDSVIQIVAGGGDACVVAFDLTTGEEKWRSLDERAGYSAPMLIQQGGQDVVVCWTGESLSGLNPNTGKLHWSVSMHPRNMPIGVATPAIEGNFIFVSSFYDGSMLVRFDPSKPEAKKIWHRMGIDEKNTDSLHCMISSPLIKGDHIYGVDSYGEFRCLDLMTGDRVWEDKTVVPRARWATIHTIRDGQREIMLNDQGQLLFAKLTPEGVNQSSRTKLLAPTRMQLNKRGGVTWAHPAIANGHIYARSDKELVCASLLD